MSSLGTSCKSSPAPMFAACSQTPLHQSFKRPSAPLFTIHLFPNSERRMANPKCTLPTATASNLRCRRGSRQDMVCQCIHHHFVQRISGSRSFSCRKKATFRCSSCNHLATIRLRLQPNPTGKVQDTDGSEHTRCFGSCPSASIMQPHYQDRTAWILTRNVRKKSRSTECMDNR